MHDLIQVTYIYIPIYICRVKLYTQVFSCRTDNNKTKQLSRRINHLPSTGIKHWQEPAPCYPDVTNFPARLAFLPTGKCLPSLSCVCLGSPARWQARVGLGEMYSGTKRFRPTESKGLFGHLGPGYMILSTWCHICSQWREMGPGEQGNSSGARPVWRDKSA